MCLRRVSFLLLNSSKIILLYGSVVLGLPTLQERGTGAASAQDTGWQKELRNAQRPQLEGMDAPLLAPLTVHR